MSSLSIKLYCAKIPNTRTRAMGNPIILNDMHHPRVTCPLGSYTFFPQLAYLRQIKRYVCRVVV